MKKLILPLTISCLFIGAANANTTTLQCQAGLVGLGESFTLNKTFDKSTTSFSGGDHNVHFWVQSDVDTLTLQTAAVQSAQKTVQHGPALLSGQEATQIFQINIAGANTAYFLKCEAP